MGIFSSEKISEIRGDKETVYSSIKKLLKIKDGKIHILAVTNSCSKEDYMFVPEEKYTEQIDTIISCMQDNGYEIIDIKATSLVRLGSQGAISSGGSIERVHTLIMYR